MLADIWENLLLPVFCFVKSILFPNFESYWKYSPALPRGAKSEITLIADEIQFQTYIFIVDPHTHSL